MAEPAIRLIEDFSDTDIGLGDYIRLRHLKVGDLIYLKDIGFGTKVLLVGNGTPFEGVSTISHDGYDYVRYNQYKVFRVYRLELEADWMTTKDVPIVTAKHLADHYATKISELRKEKRQEA